ncbi:MAG: hypothetical protein ACXV2A_02560 [Halobacteriota archaeon]
MRYQDDPDEVPRRLRVKQGVPRSTLDQRVTKLEHKVAELSSVLNGITQQLVDVSSSVHDMALLPRVNESNELPSETEPAEPLLVQSERKKKTTYIIADADCAPEPQRRLGNDIIIADREL